MKIDDPFIGLAGITKSITIDCASVAATVYGALVSMHPVLLR
jgi:hypothetical protein